MSSGFNVTRRRFVQIAAAGALLSCTSADGKNGSKEKLMQVAFVSHGAPSLALDRERGAEFERWAASMARPSAILVVSAHWQASPVQIGTISPTGLLHDYSGFEPALRDVEYPAPGARSLAEAVEELLGGVEHREDRAWDHGVWVPLVHMYPEADIPLLQLSLPGRCSPAELVELGERLRPLRRHGVLIVGSGGMVHNLGALDWSESAPAPRWARSFEDWALDALREDPHEALARLEEAPDLDMAHPTLEHIQPLLVAAGAANEGDAVSIPIDGFEFSSLSKTVVQFG